jgi:hypothetical protein
MDQQSAAQKIGKRVYRPPQLQVYGNLGQITAATQPEGMGDGGTSGTSKTN